MVSLRESGVAVERHIHRTLCVALLDQMMLRFGDVTALTSYRYTVETWDRFRFHNRG